MTPTIHLQIFKVLNRRAVTHQVHGEDIKRLLFIGVGCQVQALRSVEEDLGLDELYVLGTNCVDNPRDSEALHRFTCNTLFSVGKHLMFSGGHFTVQKWIIG